MDVWNVSKRKMRQKMKAKHNYSSIYSGYEEVGEKEGKTAKLHRLMSFHLFSNLSFQLFLPVLFFSWHPKPPRLCFLIPKLFLPLCRLLSSSSHPLPARFSSRLLVAPLFLYFAPFPPSSSSVTHLSTLIIISQRK